MIQTVKKDRMDVKIYALLFFIKEEDNTLYPHIISMIQIQNAKEFMGQKFMQ